MRKEDKTPETKEKETHFAFFGKHDFGSNKSNKFFRMTIRAAPINSSPRDDITSVDNILKKLRLIPEQCKCFDETLPKKESQIPKPDHK